LLHFALDCSITHQVRVCRSMVYCIYLPYRCKEFNLFFQLVFVEFLLILFLVLLILFVGFFFSKGAVWTKDSIGHFRSDDSAAGTHHDPHAGLPAAQAKCAASWFL